MYKKEDVMNSALPLEEKSLVGDKTVDYLSALMSDAIIVNLWNYFNEFMLTKLKIAKILPPVDLSEGENKNEGLTSQYNAIEGLVSQFSREIKPALLKQFVEIVQYAYNFRLCYPYYQEEIQQLTKGSLTSGYKAVIVAMLDHIPTHQRTANGKSYLGFYQRLQNFSSDLQQCYDSLHQQAHELLDHHYANSLISIERRFNDSLEVAAERLLRGVLTSNGPVSLRISSAQEVAAAEAAYSLQAKKQQYYIRKYEENLRLLTGIEDSKKDLFLFTLALKRCLNQLTRLTEASKAIDNFWKDSQINLNALEDFIINHKGDETAQNYLVNYIEEARWDFEFLEDYARHLAASTSIRTSASGGKNDLKLAFLLKDSVAEK
jgi:hypothetical protein